jgi:hypothetical protein
MSILTRYIFNKLYYTKLFDNNKFACEFTTIEKFTSDYFYKNFSLNREPDTVRINEIYEYYKAENITLIPGVICGIIVDELITFEIYDGIHRFLAAMKRYKEDGISMDFIVKMILTYDINDAINDFKNINKSINLPDIYLQNPQETKSSKIVIIENVMNKICKQFSGCQSSSRHPQKQNFNRDNFIEILSSIHDKAFEISGFETTLHMLINEYNDICKNHVMSYQYTGIRVQKSYKYNFWINYLPSHQFYNFLIEKTKNL